MTISSETRKSAVFIGDGVTKVFPFTFALFAAADADVYVSHDAVVDDLLVFNTDYTVTLNGDQNANPGGTVTLTVPLASGWNMVIMSGAPYVQSTNFNNQGGGFLPGFVTTALDKIVIMVQQLQEQVARTAKGTVAGIGGADVSTLVYGVDAQGNPVLKALASIAASTVSTFVSSLLSLPNATAFKNALGLAGPLMGHRNKVINGAFNVNQRDVSGTVTLAAGEYGHDGWKAGASGCVYTFATSDNVTTITISSGSLRQVVDGAFLLSGTYTLSWQGSAQGKINSGNFAYASTSAALTGGQNCTIEFGVGTLALVQLERGSKTDFEMRLNEIFLCQRYLVPFPVNFIRLEGNASAAGNGRAAYGTLLPNKMRASPSVSPITYTTSNIGNITLYVTDSTFVVECECVSAYRFFLYNTNKFYLSAEL